MIPIQGWLDKKSMIGTWSKRYFTLKTCKLSIYKDSTDSTPESEYKLDSRTIIETNSSNNHQFKIKIQKRKGTILTLRASSSNNMTEWILNLRHAAYANKSVSINMFHMISLIACGMYGKIMLCSKKNTSEIVVIKTIKKKKVCNTKKVSSVLNEKKILSTIRNPFIIGLKYAFQNRKNYYLALEYASGGDLFQILKSDKILLQDIKLYIAELAIAIQELHKNNIIYRDMKPENVIICKDGHIKLIDFGLSTFCDDNQPKTTFCGTPEFIAPEVIIGQGYDDRIDWWGLGILTYELIYKSTPFYGMNVQYIYQSILTKDPVFPKNENPMVVSFISSLLQKDPVKRGGYNYIVDSDLFSDLDFNSVSEKKISPSFIPDIDNILNQNSINRKSFNSDSDSDIQQIASTDDNRADDFSFNYIHDIS